MTRKLNNRETNYILIGIEVDKQKFEYYKKLYKNHETMITYCYNHGIPKYYVGLKLDEYREEERHSIFDFNLDFLLIKSLSRALIDEFYKQGDDTITKNDIKIIGFETMDEL